MGSFPDRVRSEVILEVSLEHTRPSCLFVLWGFCCQTQSVFSLGYGEDDDKAGDVLTVPLGAGRLVSAVDEVCGAPRAGTRVLQCLFCHEICCVSVFPSLLARFAASDVSQTMG